MPNFHTTPLDHTLSEQALILVCEDFCRNSPLHQALGITNEEFYAHMSPQWESYAHKGPIDSLAVIDESTNEVAGCIFPSVFPSSYASFSSLPEKQKPISALLQQLETQHTSSSEPSVNELLVDIAVVKQSYAGQGIYQQLRTELHQQAASAGYKHIYGELSSAVTQHVCVQKMKHRIVSEIRYSEFEYTGYKPFASITNPPYIQLVVTNLMT